MNLFETTGKFLQGIREKLIAGAAVSHSQKDPNQADEGSDVVKILKKSKAMRVIFFYPGEEGTYVDNAEVTLYENGIVHLRSNNEETTTHLQNCEIMWQFEVEGDERANKVRLLKPKTDKPRNKDTDPENSPEL